MENSSQAQLYDLNPHLTNRQHGDYPCPHGACDGSGFVLDEAANVARPCRCRAQRITIARTRNLRHAIPKKYRDLAWEREPVVKVVRDMEPLQRQLVRDYCLRIDERLDAGDGLWFIGGPGGGKTTLAMLVSQHALRAGRAAVIYTVPQLLNDLYSTYEAGSGVSYRDLIERLRTTDLLHLEDLAVVEQPKSWVLEQFYTVINDRYSDEKSVMFTADVDAPPTLAKHVGARTYSRLIEMCGDPILMFGNDHRIDPPISAEG